jgi:hypothetical protein
MHGLGVDCGIDLPTLVQTAWFAAGLLGRAHLEGGAGHGNGPLSSHGHSKNKQEKQAR